MIKQPDFVTKRLKLLPISHRHAASLWPILSHPMVRQYNDIPEFVDKMEFRDYLQTDIELWYQGQGGRWVIDFQGKIIGSCGLYPLNDECSHLQLSFELSPDYWRQGLMYEACSRLFEASFSELNIPNRPIFARCKAQNVQSITLLEKLGFKYATQTEQYHEYTK